MRWTVDTEKAYLNNRVRVGTDCVQISTFHRVHFGALDLNQDPPFGGGLGFCIPELKFSVTASRTATKDDAINLALDDECRIYMERLGIDINGIYWSLDGELFKHKGLGSQTQLYIAMIQAARLLQQTSIASMKQLAEVGIGAFSSIGLRLAFNGTPVLDLGRVRDNAFTHDRFSIRIPLDGAFRFRFPSNWLIGILIPKFYVGLNTIDDTFFWDSILPLPEERSLLASYSILQYIIVGTKQDSLSVFNQGLKIYNEAGAKPEEWSIQPREVHELRQFLKQNGYEPILSSVGPSMVVFGDNTLRTFVNESKNLFSNWRIIFTKGTVK